MALRKTITVEGKSSVLTPYGAHNKGTESVTIQDAYIRVEELQGSKQQITFTASINADTGSMLKMKFQFQPTMNDANFIAQAYAHLKSLDEFADAVDC